MASWPGSCSGLREPCVLQNIGSCVPLPFLFTLGVFAPAASDKGPALDKKGAKVAEGRGKGSLSGSDASGVSVTVHPPPGEGNDGEQGERRNAPRGLGDGEETGCASTQACSALTSFGPCRIG